MTKKKGKSGAAAPKKVDNTVAITAATEALTTAETEVTTAQEALDAAKAEGKTEDEVKPLEEALDAAKAKVEEAKTALDEANTPAKDDEDTEDEEDEELPEGSYTVKVNIKHNGTRYAPGDTIEVGGEEGTRLLADGAIE